ncbi:APC family permease [Butyricicoccus sp.]|uniref:APC family permease n=1 Tax=Butyricicoccus sp. TaxID=2049021 RepID=UPI003F15060D
MEKSKFNKVLGMSDVLVIAFGAMIGWAWVVSTGDWISTAGTIGAIFAFVIGGIMVFLVSLTYAELTSAMPQCGGEHVFSYRAMGPNASFVCTWAIVLGYASVAAFEACAMPTVITYIFPNFLQGYMYTIAGFDVYASWVAVAVIAAIIITYINLRGVKTAAILQTVFTVLIAAAGIALVAASAVNGSGNTLMSYPFADVEFSDCSKLGGILTIAVMTPFYFVGFDVIPQVAEEINIPYKKLGKIMLLSIIMAVAFYALVVFGVGYILPVGDMAGSDLPTASAMELAFGIPAMAKVMVIGGIAGMITSWNSFIIGGSRAMFSMAESKMLPETFAKLNPKTKAPTNAILFIGIASAIAPFFGRKMLVWIVDAGSLGVCVAYLMVSLSFLILRKKEPEMNRPYRVKHGTLVGVLAVIMSGFFTVLYIIPLPFASTALVWQEWIVAGLWIVLGVVFFGYCKKKYGAEFGRHIDVMLDERLMEKD